MKVFELGGSKVRCRTEANALAYQSDVVVSGCRVVLDVKLDPLDVPIDGAILTLVVQVVASDRWPML
jgi:hypothetical protein